MISRVCLTMRAAMSFLPLLRPLRIKAQQRRSTMGHWIAAPHRNIERERPPAIGMVQRKTTLEDAQGDNTPCSCDAGETRSAASTYLLPTTGKDCRDLFRFSGRRNRRCGRLHCPSPKPPLTYFTGHENLLPLDPRKFIWPINSIKGTCNLDFNSICKAKVNPFSSSRQILEH